MEDLEEPRCLLWLNLVWFKLPNFFCYLNGCSVLTLYLAGFVFIAPMNLKLHVWNVHVDVGLNFLGRSLLEVMAPATAKPSSSFILAQERTHRKDPLDNYNYYSGGWNISDKHYWVVSFIHIIAYEFCIILFINNLLSKFLQSVGFTAIPFFLIGIIWFVAFGLVLLLICCRFCCPRRTKYSYSRTAYALSLIFLVLFTIAVM